MTTTTTRKVTPKSVANIPAQTDTVTPLVIEPNVTPAVHVEVSAPTDDASVIDGLIKNGIDAWEAHKANVADFGKAKLEAQSAVNLAAENAKVVKAAAEVKAVEVKATRAALAGDAATLAASRSELKAIQDMTRRKIGARDVAAVAVDVAKSRVTLARDVAAKRRLEAEWDDARVTVAETRVTVAELAHKVASERAELATTGDTLAALKGKAAALKAAAKAE